MEHRMVSCFNMRMDEIRKAIDAGTKKPGKSRDGLSSALGKRPGYVSDYFKKGSPRQLSVEQRIIAAEYLEIPPEDLGVADYKSPFADADDEAVRAVFRRVKQVLGTIARFHEDVSLDEGEVEACSWAIARVVCGQSSVDDAEIIKELSTFRHVSALQKSA